MALALANLSVEEPPVINLAKFVPLAEAAQLLGCNDGHLRRRCSHELSGKGLALVGIHPAGGNKRWFVSRSLDPRLAPKPETPAIDLPGEVPADFLRCSQAQREAALARVDCVQAFKTARATWQGTAKDWMPKLLAMLRERHPALVISEPSIYRWAKAYRNVADIMALVDKRGGNTRGQADPAAWDHFASLFLTDRQLSIKTCWKRTAEKARKEGWTWISYDAVTRQVDDRIAPERQTYYRTPNNYRSPHVEVDPDTWPSRECWLGDHCQLDLWCRFRGDIIRPWLTVWMDWRSRRICGWVLSAAPNSGTILAALRAGILDPSSGGGPCKLYHDNGKDYDASFLHGQTKKERREKMRGDVFGAAEHKGLYACLGFEVIHALPFNARAKGKLERWFGTVHDQFDRTKITYTGRSPEHRPEGLANVLANPLRVPTFEAIRGELADYIRCYNASADHAKDDMASLSPDACYPRLFTALLASSPRPPSMCCRR